MMKKTELLKVIWLVPKNANIAELNKILTFKRREILMEISRKYNDAILNTIISKSDFEIKGRLTDSKSIFQIIF
jgi:uncharacterized SAM-dependent methyltransferase